MVGVNTLDRQRGPRRSPPGRALDRDRRSAPGGQSRRPHQDLARSRATAAAVDAALGGAEGHRRALASISWNPRLPPPRPGSPPASGRGRLREVFGEYRGADGRGAVVR
ncbi:hypothetical protein ACRAWD_09405 [Caulobacter segnis]